MIINSSYRASVMIQKFMDALGATNFSVPSCNYDLEREVPRFSFYLVVEEDGPDVFCHFEGLIFVDEGMTDIELNSMLAQLLFVECEQPDFEFL